MKISRTCADCSSMGWDCSAFSVPTWVPDAERGKWRPPPGECDHCGGPWPKKPSEVYSPRPTISLEGK